MAPNTRDMAVKKRDGRLVSFDSTLIRKAMEYAFLAEQKLTDRQQLSDELLLQITDIVATVVTDVCGSSTADEGVSVEAIQDAVERQLMHHGHYAVARRYIVYREEHARARNLRNEPTLPGLEEDSIFQVAGSGDGTKVPFDSARLRQRLFENCRGLEGTCSADDLLADVQKQLFDGITAAEISRASILAARSRIERDPAYDKVAVRQILAVIYDDALGESPSGDQLDKLYRDRFAHFIDSGVSAGRLDAELQKFDLPKLAAALKIERDANFPYLGLQTIYDRYLLHIDGRRIETPQYFWMRVAMGLAVREGEEKNQRAIEFYEILSTFRFVSATPTLFNSGTPHPQLSSCYLSTVMDELDNIFKTVSDNAKLSKWAGGLGNDWTNIRATGAHINGTNGQSQGVIPFLKVVNDTAVAVNQGGKRKGAVCAYLETWHLDVEEFLDLRKNTGDERRRTHDMHTAHWIPDLFMQRVEQGGQWTLFSPHDVPDLHDLTGRAFAEHYAEYERMADAGEIKHFRRLDAVGLWRKMLTRLFETGHPWITWKDPSNIRSPQDHVGVVHSSNLCTEILLNTSRDETAVCNLGSVNLKVHTAEGHLDTQLLESTVRTAMRMLDNVIDINFYPTEEARQSNTRHRPVGLGVMGFQDALLKLGISYASDEAMEFADRSMEAISYYAIRSSAELAGQRGAYSTYRGSKWDRGLLPIDTIDLLQEQRGSDIEMDRSSHLDWQAVRDAVAEYGMRNSNVMAIAPTATISTIVGVSQSIEPTYKHLFVKSNLSGEFTQVNSVLIEELKSRGLWDDEMLESLKYYDGSLRDIERVPDDVKQRFATAFEIDSHWLIEAASRRQKWIDMGQSLNLYLSDPNGRKLHEMYMLAWKKGLKTTYYLRTLAATQIEKSTVDVNRFSIQPRWMKNRSASSDIQISRQPPIVACNLDEDCEACQ